MSETAADRTATRERTARLPFAPRDERVVALALGLFLAALAGAWLTLGGHAGRLQRLDAVADRPPALEVDVNHAAWPELALLPEIGETLAHRIVDSRDRDGPFARLEDLDRVEGVGPKTLEKLRPYVRFGQSP